MQLSKQEFSKLSVKDQKRLMLNKQKPRKTLRKKQQQNNPRPSSGQRTNSRQASVAAAYATRTVGKAPRVTASRDSCRVVHREFIANITGSVAYTLSQSLSVNPGLSATFPWLSVMSQAWEEYKFNKLKFCYYTRTGSNTPGSVLISPDYDASDAAPSSELVQSSYDETVEDAPWKDICCTLKAQLASGPMKRHYIRNAALAPNQDIKMYDIANLFVGTVDGTAVAWGKLWVEYDVEFYIPQLPPSGANTSAIFGGQITGGGTQNAANPLGTVPVLDPQAVGISVNATSVITILNPGTYQISGNAIGTGLTGFALTPSATIVGSGFGQLFNTAATTGFFSEIFVASAAGTISLTMTATTVTGAQFIVASAPFGSLA